MTTDTNANATYTDLELRIHKRTDVGYPIELTVDGQREFDGGVLSLEPLPWIPMASPTAEGEALFNWLFADELLQRQWSKVWGLADRRRVRLRIDAPDLHAIPWELLRDPDTGLTLAADANTPFSRYLAGDFDPGQPLSERPIRMLVAIAGIRRDWQTISWVRLI